MKKIIKTLLVVMVLALVVAAFVACDQEAPACEHKGGTATCTAAPVCELCGESYGEALGHKGGTSTCTALGICATCGQEYGELKEHTPEYYADEYHCTEEGLSAGASCSVCGEVLRKRFPLKPTGHNMTEGSCTEDAVCLNECGYVEVAPGHKMEEVEALAPTCTEDGYTAHTACACGHTEGKETVEAPGHEMADATCTAPATCSVCGHTEGESLGGHTPGAEATCTTAQVCTVCNEVLVAKLGHVDANLDVECDREGCTSKVAPPADSVLSNFTANNLGSKLSTDSKYYVVGTIVEVLDARNGIFLVDDGTGEKFYFRLPVNADGVSHANWTIKLVLGDKVQIYGKINKFTASNAPNGQYWPAMQAPVVTVLEQHPHDFTFKPATCSEPAYCACGQSQGKPLGCADTDDDQLCDDCGRNVNYAYEYVEIRTDNESGVIDTAAGTYTWENGNFAIQVLKGTSSQLYSTAKDHMRVYKGNNFVLVNKNGLAVKTITVYVTNATQVANFEKLLTGYTYVKNEENFTITFEVSALETLTLVNSGSTTQIKGVEFGYEKPEEPALSNAVLDCTTKDNRVSFSTEEQVWSQNGITLTLKRGEGTAYSDKAPITFASKGSLTIEGSGIKTIVIETGNTTYGTYVNNCFNGQPGVASSSAKSGVVTIVLSEEVDSFTIESLAKQGQIKKITINPEA